MNLWLLILLMVASLAGSFFAWLNTSEWTESENPGKHMLWWFTSIVCLGLSIVCFIGFAAGLHNALKVPEVDNARAKAQCDSIEGKYALGYCYKNGIQINWSTYGKEE